MARTYFVKKAQQRYATKPVIDEATGQPKQSPKMRNGVQMTTKQGRPVFMTVTERDLTQPLPMPKCSKCGVEIAVGQPYKYTETYNRTIIRCGTCPVPHEWEYSSSLGARVAQIQHEGAEAIGNAGDADELTSAASDIAGQIRELAEEKRESASNIEEGFGHATYQSEELEGQADELDSWADEVEGADVEFELEIECEECEGSVVTPAGEDPCEACGGTGQIENEDGLEQARTNLQEALDGCPL